MVMRWMLKYRCDVVPSMSNLKAPFPYFGGKSTISHEVWNRFGDVDMYVEPFFGSGAVLLNRPMPFRGFEMANDMNGMIVNFWRSVKYAPEDVADHAEWYVSEIDLVARNQWVIDRRQNITNQMRLDPLFYDAKVAGWWVWCMSNWIGSGCCEESRKGKGINKLPNLGRTMGVLKKSIRERPNGLHDWIYNLSQRFRNVQVICGDWERSVTEGALSSSCSFIGVFLDPPYTKKAGRMAKLYVHDDLVVGNQVFDWVVENGNNKKMRIAVCGFEGEYEFPQSWECVSWKSNGGYSKPESTKNNNKEKERIWFSPHCLKPNVLL